MIIYLIKKLMIVIKTYQYISLIIFSENNETVSCGLFKEINNLKLMIHVLLKIVLLVH